MEPIDEKKQFVRFELLEGQRDLELSAGLVVLLWDRSDLLSLYVKMVWLSQIKLGILVKQPEVAKILGVGYVAYYQKRKELEELGLIIIKRDTHNMTQIVVKTTSLMETIRRSYENHKTYSLFRTANQLVDNIVETSKTLKEVARNSLQEEGQTQLFNNIYINNTKNTNNIINNNSVNSVNSVNSNKSNTNVVKKVTYPKEDYTLVINAFKKYKGIELAGPEITYHLRAIKLMFQAKHSPKEIIDFMKWLHDNEDNEETPWVHHWTVWTVQKKIPEFLAGKLKIKTLADSYKEYGK